MTTTPTADADLTARIANASAFIANLPPIAPPATGELEDSDSGSSTPPPPQQPGTPSSSVAGGTQMAFTANLDATHKTDLLYALGFVQLQVAQGNPNANPPVPAYQPQSQPVEYFNGCVTMLQNIGFTIQDLTWANYNTSAQTYELDTVVLEIIGGLVSGPELELVTAAVKALEAAADTGDPSWTIYSSNSRSDNAGGVAVGVADETTSPIDGSTSVSLQLSAFAFAGTEDHTKFLWMTYNATELSMQDASTTFVFNDVLWNSPGVGDAIMKAMGVHSASYIHNLPPLKS